MEKWSKMEHHKRVFVLIHHIYRGHVFNFLLEKYTHILSNRNEMLH